MPTTTATAPIALELTPIPSKDDNPLLFFRASITLPHQHLAVVKYAHRLSGFASDAIIDQTTKGNTTRIELRPMTEAMLMDVIRALRTGLAFHGGLELQGDVLSMQPMFMDGPIEWWVIVLTTDVITEECAKQLLQTFDVGEDRPHDLGIESWENGERSGARYFVGIKFEPDQIAWLLEQLDQEAGRLGGAVLLDGISREKLAALAAVTAP